MKALNIEELYKIPARIENIPLYVKKKMMQGESIFTRMIMRPLQMATLRRTHFVNPCPIKVILV